MLLRFASQATSGTKSKLPLVIVAVLLFGTAGFLAYWSTSSDSAQLDTAESSVDYICWDDGHTFKLTPAQWDALLKKGDIQYPGGNAPVAAERGSRGGETKGVRAVKCPKCGKFSCVVALPCPGGKMIPKFTRDGQLAECPQ